MNNVCHRIRHYHHRMPYGIYRFHLRDGVRYGIDAHIAYDGF